MTSIRLPDKEATDPVRRTASDPRRWYSDGAHSPWALTSRRCTTYPRRHSRRSAGARASERSSSRVLPASPWIDDGISSVLAFHPFASNSMSGWRSDRRRASSCGCCRRAPRRRHQRTAGIVTGFILAAAASVLRRGGVAERCHRPAAVLGTTPSRLRYCRPHAHGRPEALAR